MKRIIIISITLVSSLITIAQQDAMFTHYAFNTLAVNPGYAGSRDAITITGLHRSQWVSFPGAPTTQTLTFHGPAFQEKVGLGLSILNDKIGPVNTTAFYGDFAYKLRVGKKGKLAFGLKGGVNVVQRDLAGLSLGDETQDDAFAQNIKSSLLPNFGFGLYYSTTKWYVGLSIPKLLQNNFKTNSTAASISNEQRHYFLIGGTVINLKEDGSLKLKPTTFVKVTEAAPVEMDLTAMLIIQDKLELGVMGRSGDALGVLLGYNFTNELRFGYSFDWSFVNKTGKYNAGSHEVMLRYDFITRNKGRIRSPRYF